MNPYRLAARRQRAAHRRVHGLAGWVGLLLPVLAGAAAGRLAPSPFFDPGRDVAAGLADIGGRVAVLLAAGVALAAYQAVVRGPDRGVVDLHPVDGPSWFDARLEEVARGSVPWLLAALAFVHPLGVGTAAYAVVALGLVLGWFVAVCAGVGVNTVAPALGLDPRWAPVLDGIRGPNPRLQAALLYAPGVALTVAGLAALAGTAGAAALVEGRPEAWEMLVPLVVGVGVVAAARRRAQEVVRYPVVLGEIEAAWAAREQGEEARHVYLDWVVRLVPAGWRRDLTRELRHLWRTQRGWSLAAWAFAALAALESWSGGAQVGVAGVAIVALGAVRAGAEDPPWLDAWLDLGPWRRAAARAGSVALHASPVVLGTGVGFLHGHAAPLVAAAAALVLVALLSAGVSVALRARAVPVYLPFAVLVWGVLS